MTSDCVVCGGVLSGRQRKFCSAGCRKLAGRAAWIAKTYGISLAEWDLIWVEQGEVCAICQRPPRAGEVFHLDHEHTTGPTGTLRGILCPHCNTRLVGRLKDAAKARRLADYLADPPAVRAIGHRVAPGRPRRKRQPRKRAR